MEDGALTGPGDRATAVPDTDRRPVTARAFGDGLRERSRHHGIVPADLSAVSWPIHTARLTIRPATPADADRTWRFRRLPTVDQWLSSRSTTLEEYRTKFTDPERLSKMFIVELGGVVIGDLMLAVKNAWAQSEVQDQALGVQAELGWCLDPDHHRNGYATEAVTELLRICFADLGLRRVTASCFADNTASWLLMERLHLRRESHTVCESLHRNGQWLDGYGYALLADEWRKAQALTHP